jgi:hypothetical protein
MCSSARDQMTLRLQILVSEPLAAAVGMAAVRRRVSSGEWVRRAIERAMDE